jgi:hypothetical protein
LGKKGYTIYKINLNQKQIKKLYNELNVKTNSHLIQSKQEYPVYKKYSILTIM